MSGVIDTVVGYGRVAIIRTNRYHYKKNPLRRCNLSSKCFGMIPCCHSPKRKSTWRARVTSSSDNSSADSVIWLSSLYLAVNVPGEILAERNTEKRGVSDGTVFVGANVTPRLLVVLLKHLQHQGSIAYIESIVRVVKARSAYQNIIFIVKSLPVVFPGHSHDRGPLSPSRAKWAVGPCLYRYLHHRHRRTRLLPPSTVRTQGRNTILNKSSSFSCLHYLKIRN